MSVGEYSARRTLKDSRLRIGVSRMLDYILTKQRAIALMKDCMGALYHTSTLVKATHFYSGAWSFLFKDKYDDSVYVCNVNVNTMYYSVREV